MSVFSERLLSLMSQKGVTQKQLASEVQVTESAMSHYVKGDRVPYGDVVVRIANALETSTDYLLGNVDTPASDFNSLSYLQRKVGQLNPEEQAKAENVLKAVFDDIFNDDDEDD